MWRTGLAAPWHVGSSQIRDPTGVTCIARQILSRWTTRKPFLKKYLFLAVLGLRGHAGFSLGAVLRLLLAVASLVAEHQL